MVASGGLPWKKIKDKNDVKESKMRSRVEGNSEFEALYKGITKCQPNLVKIINYIDGLKYVESKDLACLIDPVNISNSSPGLRVHL